MEKEKEKNIAAAVNCGRAMPERGAKVQQVFLDADLRFAITGLVQVCKDHDIDISKRGAGELIVFINSDRNNIKVLACNNTEEPILAQKRLTSGRIFDLGIIREIPRAFRGSGEIDFHEAAEKAFIKSLPARMRKVAEEKLGAH